MNHYVFCYGTLMRGGINHYLLNDCEYMADGIVDGAGLIDMGGCPGMLLGQVDTVDLARGEIYRMGDARATLYQLDQLENEGRMYKRVSIPVWITDDQGERTGRGYTCAAYVYMPRLALDYVEGGSWSPQSNGGGT